MLLMTFSDSILSQIFDIIQSDVMLHKCIRIVTEDSEIFARVLFSQNFAYAKFPENKILMKWGNHYAVH